MPQTTHRVILCFNLRQRPHRREATVRAGTPWAALRAAMKVVQYAPGGSTVKKNLFAIYIVPPLEGGADPHNR